MQIVTIDNKRNYWLVRTKAGSLYEEFIYSNIISIGWDKITSLNGNEDTIINRIQQFYPNEKQPRYAYNQMSRFINEIKINDVVLIPSVNSEYVTFGIVESDVTILKNKDIADGILNKRRKMKWVTTELRKKLDPNLFWLFSSHHIISNANDYAQYIDKTLNSFYIKGEYGHFIINVKKEDSINALDMVSISYNMLELIRFVNVLEDTNYEPSDLKQKSNIQSPGKIEYIGPSHLISLMGYVVQLIIHDNFITAIQDKTQDEVLISNAKKFRQSYLEGLSNLDADLPSELMKNKENEE